MIRFIQLSANKFISQSICMSFYYLLFLLLIIYSYNLEVIIYYFHLDIYFQLFQCQLDLETAWYDSR